jgi:S-adenosylmethionine synthetase
MPTGASGVLGTQVYHAFVQAGHEVLGLAHSRASGKLKEIDLMNEAKTNEIFGDVNFKPDCK